jgi:phosphatidylglycerophosphate synthase
MIFGASFDLVDGQVARLTGKASKSGAFFDSVMDRFGEAVVFLGLASYYRSTWVLYFVVMALVGSMMVSYTRARGEGVGVDVKKGIMQRAERIVYLGVGSIFSPILAYSLSSWVKTPLDFMTIGAIILIAIFTNLGALYRIRYVIHRLDPRPRESNTFLSRLIHRWSTGE